MEPGVRPGPALRSGEHNAMAKLPPDPATLRIKSITDAKRVARLNHMTATLSERAPVDQAQSANSLAGAR